MSLNDPRWGDESPPRPSRPTDDRQDPPGSRRPPEDGPPDLDEVWREFNQRLNALFGQRGGDGGAPPRRTVGPDMPPHFGKVTLLVLLAGLAIWLASGFYKVEANERGVVLRFGRYVETTEPGLRWRLPYPIERHEIVDLSGVRTVEVGYRGSERNRVMREALMLTDDENIVQIFFAVQYLLKSPEDYLFRDRAPDEAVKQVAESAMREIVGKSKMDYVLYEGREDIAARAQALMQTMLDRYQTGVQVVRVTLQNAQPPEQVQAAFDDAVKAGQDRERLRNEGEAYANAVIPRARGTASRMIEEAQAYRARVVEQARGDAQRFLSIYEQYRLAPAVTRERLYLETLQQVFQHTSKVIVDAEASGHLLMLPLAEMLARGSAPTEGAAKTGRDGAASFEELMRDANAAAPSSSQTESGRSVPRERGARP